MSCSAIVTSYERFWKEKSEFMWKQICATSLLFCALNARSATEFAVTSDTLLELSGTNDARQALLTEDHFIRALSEFDRAARLKSEQPVSREQFLKFIEGAVLPWNDEEKSKLEKAAAGAKHTLSQFKMALPRRILLVQTTGQEEGHAAYCRGTNIIVLPRRYVMGSARSLESVLIHEVFHILSRNNSDLRTQLYALVGFKPCNEIRFPPMLESRRLTNPDAPQLNYLLEVQHQGRKRAVVPILFATPARWNQEKGGEFFAYLTWKLLALEQLDGHWGAPLSDGKPVLLTDQDVTGWREQIGEQPGPVLQAEEILADYFVRVLEGRDKVPPPVAEGMRRLLGR